ncbi:MAG TPA: hypothetical protein DEP73_20915, partial [Pseudomonas sp.]|nr:hypothetical protein [Pseudomonas sp.]
MPALFRYSSGAGAAEEPGGHAHAGGRRAILAPLDGSAAGLGGRSVRTHKENKSHERQHPHSDHFRGLHRRDDPDRLHRLPCH